MTASILIDFTSERKENGGVICTESERERGREAERERALMSVLAHPPINVLSLSPPEYILLAEGGEGC